MAKLFLTALISVFAVSFSFASPAVAQDLSELTAATEAWLASPHADRTSESFRHWDEEGEVPVRCAACHSGPGTLDYLGADGSAVGIVDHPAVTGAPIDCATCHNAAASVLQSVEFPSGETVAELGSSTVCAVCHQGRASGDDVDASIGDLDGEIVSGDLGFLNVHYRAAAATLMGSSVRGGYQYEGKIYVGKFAHVENLNVCADCHNPHSLEIEIDNCSTCHAGIAGLTDIRIGPTDADGDGDTNEGVAGEIATLQDVLDQAIRSYASDISGAPIVYSSTAYPYFFVDTNGDGQVQPEESVFPNRYQSWTPRLLRAAYNYQFAAKDPGAYAHNPRYALQLLYDSIEDLASQTGTDMSGFVRP